MADVTGNIESTSMEEVYKHTEWRSEAMKYEQEFARDLYDRFDVRKAGQEALSKISTLLVRYNRLRQMERKKEEIVAENMTEENGRYNSIKEKYVNELTKAGEELANLGEEPKETPENQDAVKAYKERKATLEKEMDRLKGALAEADSEHKKREIKIRTGARMLLEEGMANTLDRDDSGGIRAATMLGGNAEGARGYTMDEGSSADIRKAGNYISEIENGEGTFKDQMSLIDNAVNSGGVALPEAEGSQNVASNLNQVFREINEAELSDMNGSWQTQENPNTGHVSGRWASGTASKENTLKLNMSAIKEAQEKKEGAGSLDDMIGKLETPKDIAEVAKTRGISDEAKKRNKGKAGTLSTKAENKAAKKLLVPHGFVKRSFFGKAFEREWKSPKKAFASRNQKLRRMQMRARADEIRVRLNERQERVTTRRVKNNNVSDAAKTTLKKLGAKEEAAVQDLEKTGFLSVFGKNAIEDGVDDAKQGEEAVKNLSASKSAKNMLGAARLLFEDDEDWLKFRLALISYFVPSGKMTIYDIIKQSHEIMKPDGDDLSEPAAMYRSIDPFNEEQIVELNDDRLFPDEVVANKMEEEHKEDEDWKKPVFKLKKKPAKKKEKKKEEPEKKVEEKKEEKEKQEEEEKKDEEKKPEVVLVDEKDKEKQKEEEKKEEEKKEEENKDANVEQLIEKDEEKKEEEKKDEEKKEEKKEEEKKKIEEALNENPEVKQEIEDEKKEEEEQVKEEQKEQEIIALQKDEQEKEAKEEEQVQEEKLEEKEQKDEEKQRKEEKQEDEEKKKLDEQKENEEKEPVAEGNNDAVVKEAVMDVAVMEPIIQEPQIENPIPEPEPEPVVENVQEEQNPLPLANVAGMATATQSVKRSSRRRTGGVRAKDFAAWRLSLQVKMKALKGRVVKDRSLKPLLQKYDGQSIFDFDEEQLEELEADLKDAEA